MPSSGFLQRLPVDTGAGVCYSSQVSRSCPLLTARIRFAQVAAQKTASVGVYGGLHARRFLFVPDSGGSIKTLFNLMEVYGYQQRADD